MIGADYPFVCIYIFGLLNYLKIDVKIVNVGGFVNFCNTFNFNCALLSSNLLRLFDVFIMKAQG